MAVPKSRRLARGDSRLGLELRRVFPSLPAKFSFAHFGKNMSFPDGLFPKKLHSLSPRCLRLR